MRNHSSFNSYKNSLFEHCLLKMMSIAYPLPCALPSEVQDKIYLFVLGIDGTPSSRAFKNELRRYYGVKKQKTWNIYHYWGIQEFGRQCEMNFSNSAIYPLHIWCDIRMALLQSSAHALDRNAHTKEVVRLTKLIRTIFLRRYRALT